MTVFLKSCDLVNVGSISFVMSRVLHVTGVCFHSLVERRAIVAYLENWRRPTVIQKGGTKVVCVEQPHSMSRQKQRLTSR